MNLFLHSGERRRPASFVALAGLAAALACASACTTDESHGSTDSAFAVPDAGKGDLATQGDLGPPTDLACTPEVQSCSGLCGPVRDDCTGQTFQCGGCAQGTVCNLDTHVCVTPTDPCAVTPPAVACGSTKNACGQRVTCSPFYCATNTEECNPDTNRCQACTPVTCDDLGYQCGPAWLGCGPSSNTTDCGTCPGGQVCNDALHICEPSNGGTCATPAGSVTAAQMCDAAAMSDGLECGVISNGCGGLIDCTATTPSKYTCPAGQTCGGAGIPNHCDPAEPPTECIAAGFNCGTLQSACGGTVSCGTCDASQNMVCTVAQGGSAGVCSLVCNQPQKSCGVDYAGMCGNQLDNNCWPNKLDCPCGSGQVCSSSTDGVPGTCSAPKQCMMFTSGQAGQKCSNGPSAAFPKGDGTDLTCPCANAGGGPGQEVCTNVGSDGSGTCCTRSSCTGNEATVTDTCTGQTLNCCTSGQKAYNGMCCTPKTAADCPNDGDYEVIDDGCGGTVTCHCSRFPATPDDPLNPPTTVGQKVACCAPPSCGTQCSGTVTSMCSGKKTGTCTTAVCGTAPSGMTNECMNGACCQTTTFTCMSNDIYYTQVDSCGVTHVCDCNRDKDGYTSDPVNAGGQKINGNGCCMPAPACGTDCSGDTKTGACMGPSNGTVVPSRTCSASVCSNTQCCNPSTGTCKTATGCASGSCASVDNGCGTTVACSCPSGEICESNGTCGCNAPSCGGKCNPSSVTNACGQSVSCACTGAEVCGAANTCCTPQTCANLPMGKQCGQFQDSCTGNTISCGCSTPQKPNSQCDTGGQCTCTPTKCCSDTGNVKPCLQPGPYANDGCGNAGTCAT